MTACVVVQVGGLVLDGNVDGNGNRWDWTELPGWESPDVEQDLLQRTGASGLVMGTSLYRGRPLVVRGTVECSTKEVGYFAALNQASAATDLVEEAPGVLTVGEPSPKQATVWRAGPIRWRSVGGMLGATFEVPLIAPDFRKYGTTLHTVAGGAVTNAGNKRATPVVTVTGPSTNPRVTSATDDGKYVEVDVTLAGGEVLTLDMDAMTASATLHGDVAGSITAGSRWFDLLPGVNALALAGGGTLSTTFRDAYI